MFTPSGPELLIVLFIVILLFGAKKLPELARGLGTGIKEFRKATKGEVDESSSARDNEEED
jgi:sec-independent protein translocase protein TatA